MGEKRRRGLITFRTFKVNPETKGMGLNYNFLLFIEFNGCKGKSMLHSFKLSDFIWRMGHPFMQRFIITNMDDLEKAAENYGILPFFHNNIRGLSVEELCAPGILFGSNYEDGCWEWKGPVVRRKTSAYGKFYRRKAGFVALDLFPDFLNYRRNAYPVISGSTEEMLLDIIRENDSLSSTELKKFIFGKKERTMWDEFPELQTNSIIHIKRKSLESPLQRLQMGCWIIISDFEYKITKRGERYGWGVARYSTPEAYFGDFLNSKIGITPSESLEFIITSMKKRIPFISKKSLYELLK